jgi:hypothetical protein
MTVLALQNRVKKNISLIEDEVILGQINDLIDQNSKVYVLSDFQLKLVEEAREDYKTGNFITQEDLKKKVEAWKERK